MTPLPGSRWPLSSTSTPGIQGKLDDSRADLSIFSDLDSLSAYAKEPMSWAVAQGLFSGVSADTLAPGGSTTRAQAAVILTAFSKAQG